MLVRLSQRQETRRIQQPELQPLNPLDVPIKESPKAPCGALGVFLITTYLVEDLLGKVPFSAIDNGVPLPTMI